MIRNNLTQGLETKLYFVVFFLFSAWMAITLYNAVYAFYAVEENNLNLTVRLNRIEHSKALAK